MNFDVRWIGQGGFILTLGDKILCLDPYLSNSVEKNGRMMRLVPIPIRPSELHADLIVCTHDHIDHLDEQTLTYTDMTHTRYAGPSSCIEHFGRLGITNSNVIPFNQGTTITFGQATLTATFAKHTVDSIGILVRFQGISIYFTADSEYSEQLVSVSGEKSPDILVTCINGKLGNMNVSNAARLAKELAVKIAIPCHYGMFAENTESPNIFKNLLQGSAVRYFELAFDQTYQISTILDTLRGT